MNVVVITIPQGKIFSEKNKGKIKYLVKDTDLKCFFCGHVYDRNDRWKDAEYQNMQESKPMSCRNYSY